MRRTVSPVSLYEEVTNDIIQQLEKGCIPWHRPWRSRAPHNIASGRRYRGINVLLLEIARSRGGFQHSGWLTYAQAQSLGGQVRKGERGTRIAFWKQCTRSDPQSPAEADTQTTSADCYWLLRSHHVFNRAQVDGLPHPEVAVAQADSALLENWERATAHYPIAINEGGSEAFYSPHQDSVSIPAHDAFETTDAYVATLAHELVHSTGAPHRLNRDLSGRFGSEAYAVEELIAELGGAFLTTHVGAAYPRAANAAYLASWLNVLRTDSKAIFASASAAQRAADLILGESTAARSITEADSSSAAA